MISVVLLGSAAIFFYLRQRNKGANSGGSTSADSAVAAEAEFSDQSETIDPGNGVSTPMEAQSVVLDETGANGGNKTNYVAIPGPHYSYQQPTMIVNSTFLFDKNGQPIPSYKLRATVPDTIELWHNN